MTERIVEIRGLTYGWPGETVPTLRELSWQIPAGQFTLLIGRSGSGKSTLLRTINGLIPHFSGGKFSGDVVVDGNNTRQMPPRDIARSVGFVFQDPESQLLTNRVVDDIALSMEQMGTSPTLMRKRVEEMLDLVGIAHLRDRTPESLSGGERQRVAIASALALQPPVLVLDEPTSQLDPWGAEEVIAALSRLNEDLGLTIVLSEHRLERVLAHADSVRLLADDGTPTDGSPFEIARRVAAVALPPVTQLGRCVAADPLPLTIKQARAHERIASLRASLRDRVPSRSVTAPGDPMLQVSDLELRLERRLILRKASFAVHQGEFLAIIGRNGSGKTTLLRALAGFLLPTTGRIAFAADNTRGGFVLQRSGTLFFCETIADELRFTANKRGVPVDVNALLSEVDLVWAADRHPSTLSVGERQRAAIATVLAGDPSLLLLDEPTRGMDPWHKRRLAVVLRRLQNRGVAVVMATHDVELSAELASTVIMLGDGEIVAMGAPEEVLSDSFAFSTQINKIFGGRWLMLDQILAAAELSREPGTI